MPVVKQKLWYTQIGMYMHAYFRNMYFLCYMHYNTNVYLDEK